jgi:branched-chain amino acid transport system ATP-binding protein
VKMIARKVTVFHQGAILLEAPMAKVLTNATVRDVYLGRRIAA